MLQMDKYPDPGRQTQRERDSTGGFTARNRQIVKVRERRGERGGERQNINRLDRYSSTVRDRRNKGNEQKERMFEIQ